MDRYYAAPRRRFRAGEWTDDTAMTLLLAESLVRCGKFDIEDQLENYEKWNQTGYMGLKPRPVGIGQQTSAMLRLYQKYKAGELQTKPREIDMSGEQMDGNGSLMRIAPIALFFAKDPKLMLHYAAESSISTHNTQICKDACGYYTGLIRGAMHGVSKQELLQPYYAPVENYWQEKWGIAPALQAIVEGRYKTKTAEDLDTRGYVVNAFEVALWGFYNSSSFKDGMEMVVNLWWDADTNACIYGFLAGAYYGWEEIPENWLEGLMDRDRIQEMADLLYNAMLSQGEVTTSQE